LTSTIDRVVGLSQCGGADARFNAQFDIGAAVRVVPATPLGLWPAALASVIDSSAASFS
jgi:hypothetical protein